MFSIRSIAALVAILSCVIAGPLKSRTKSKGFLNQIDNTTWVFGNNVWNLTQDRQYAKKLFYKDKDLVGDAWGHYVSYNGAASDLNWTSAAIVDSGSDYINIRFTAKEGDFHWVIHDDAAGAYQYFVNHALPVLGEFRTLWRLDNQSFPNGRTTAKNGVLPPLSEYSNATNVQDETWQKADGTFLTKYDWSVFIKEQDYWGVYGREFGSWYIHPGKDYINGNHLKQELMVHRESKTGDAVQLNMIHGTHYQAISSDAFTVGKTWGPWLWYLNNGSQDDAAQRAKQEGIKWPYRWLRDPAYHSRGKLQGKLLLSDGRPASNAAIFLGDNNSNLSSLDQGRAYYYTTYADNDGKFSIKHIRTGTYTLEAWSNGGQMSYITTSLHQPNIRIRADATTNLETLPWPDPSQSNRIFQLGALDRKTSGFALSGPPYHEHGRIAKCPANLTFTIEVSSTKDWCFGQSELGTHSIVFSLDHVPLKAARLSVSLAGFSEGTAADILVNGEKVGDISGLPNSQDTYRGATLAGEWRMLRFDVAEDVLRLGENRVEFRVVKSTRWRGWLWDAVVLEWV